ncbi:MAG: creatininase family protein, partial [Dehalococcoidia bacterium]
LGVKIAHALHWPSQEMVDKYQRSPQVGHACEIETSLAMHLAPSIAKTEALAKGEMLEPTFTGGMGGGLTGIVEPQYFDQVTANGAVGDATYASAEAGEAMAQEIEDRLTAFLEDFLKD